MPEILGILIYPFELFAHPFNWFYILFFTADSDLDQDPASRRCCLNIGLCITVYLVVIRQFAIGHLN